MLTVEKIYICRTERGSTVSSQPRAGRGQLHRDCRRDQRHLPAL